VSGFWMFDPHTRQAHHLMAGSPWPDRWVRSTGICEVCGGRFRDGETLSEDGSHHRQCSLVSVRKDPER
jgi:hypothetical protein